MKSEVKKAVKTIVDSIEKEIDRVLKGFAYYEHQTEKDFDYGTFTFEMITYIDNSIGGEWDEHLLNEYAKIEVKSVSVTNENSKVLTNLSKEVFNQLEETYTNY